MAQVHLTILPGDPPVWEKRGKKIMSFSRKPHPDHVLELIANRRIQLKFLKRNPKNGKMIFLAGRCLSPLISFEFFLQFYMEFRVSFPSLKKAFRKLSNTLSDVLHGLKRENR
ncbi:hypothetical protein TNIN_51251 [Trichonephila inaurata madagascariensis]|uniref:Uncharacterized protein n=1 Tax=Trichonephila inaurata madagascariensis TaxID=2747483 RepID=A0A8X6MGA5_9ARAC|nr:hypothetical protein TNIN_51251 [Trichonephila inaurata madagascariensis]